MKYNILFLLLLLFSCNSDRFDYECTAEFTLVADGTVFFDRFVLDEEEETIDWCEPYEAALDVEVLDGRIVDLTCGCVEIPE